MLRTMEGGRIQNGRMDPLPFIMDEGLYHRKCGPSRPFSESFNPPFNGGQWTIVCPTRIEMEIFALKTLTTPRPFRLWYTRTCTRLRSVRLRLRTSFSFKYDHLHLVHKTYMCVDRVGPRMHSLVKRVLTQTATCACEDSVTLLNSACVNAANSASHSMCQSVLLVSNGAYNHSIESSSSRSVF